MATHGRWLGLSLALALAAAALLPGCQREPVEIVVWDGPRWPDENNDQFHWLRGRIQAFSQRHPDVRVRLVEKPWGDLVQLVDLAAGAGALPDVAPLEPAGGALVRWVEAGLLEPVDEYLAAPEDLTPGALAAFSHQGRTYGFPTAQAVHVLLLNRDLFAERGVPLPPGGRWSWEEFRRAAVELTFDRNEDGAIDVYGLAGAVLKGFYELWPFLYMDGARPLAENMRRCAFNRPEGVSALQKLVDLVHLDRAAHPDTGTSDVGHVFRLFALAGEASVAMAPWAPWAIAAIQTRDPFRINVAVAEYPYGDSGEPVTIGAASGWVVFRQADARKKRLVMELANFLSDTDAHYAFATRYGTFPARRSALSREPFGGNPVLARVAAMVELAEPPPNHAEWDRLEEIFQHYIQRALTGELAPRAALDAACQEVDRVLGGGR